MQVIKKILCVSVLMLSVALFAKAGGTHYLKVGEQKMLSFTPKNGVLFNSMSWRSYDTRCVRVDGPQYTSYTYVTALAPTTSSMGALVQCEYKYQVGSIYMTATEDFYITVEDNKPQEPTGISMQSSLTLNVGESYTLSPTVYPSGVSTSISWSTSDSSVASVSGNGRVTGVSEGSATIEAMTSNGYYATCRVTVGRPTVTLSISNTNTLVPRGTKVALKANPSSAQIYYTLDGSTPSSKSTLYTDSIEINQDLTLKAIGIKDGYNNSKIFTHEFSCSSLNVVQVYPSETDEFIRPFIVPTITFNDSIHPIDLSGITIKRGATNIDGKIVISGKSIGFIPENKMLAGDYSFSIPNRCIQSAKLGYNVPVNEHFRINEDIYVVKISSGYYHTMAVKSDGTLWTWGGNFCGQLADGTVSQYNERRPIKVMENVSNAVGGYGHTLILKNDKTLWSVGRNEMGELGRGYTSYTGSLGKVMSDVSAIATNGDTGYALKTNGSVYYWGSHAEYGYDRSKSSPTFITSSVKSIAAGSGDFLLMIKEDGSLWGWNDNSQGQLGDTNQTAHYTPVKIMEDVIYCAAGSRTSYAIRSDNSLWAWGYNAYGEIGDGTKAGKKIPTKILDDVKIVSADGNRALAIKFDGSLWQWGGGIITPEKIMSDVSYAVPSYFAIKNDGTLYGWGDNSRGQVGVGSYDSAVNEPTLIFDGMDKISPISLSISDCVIEVDSQMVLKPELLPLNSSYQDIKWDCNNETVLSVDNYGCITANNIGEAIVRVVITDFSGNDFKAICNVIVTEKSSEVIDPINDNNCSQFMEVYNLHGVFMGRTIENLPQGLYIVRQGNAVTKIVIK